MKIIKEIEKIKKIIKKIKMENKSISLVATMGNIHKGHLSIIKKAKEITNITIVSIFINPMQFNNEKDIKNYPRTIEQDFNLLKKNNVDIIFYPKEKQILKKTKSLHTFVEVPYLSNILEGKKRKKHFRGVTTIIAKLFNIIQPNIALFGEKDYQQLFIIKNLVNDMNYDIKIISVPTIRHKNGLAISSRNIHLTKKQFMLALDIYKNLKYIKKEIKKRQKNIKEILLISRKKLTNKGFVIDLLKVSDRKSLAPFSKNSKKIIVFLSVIIKNIRLIDNIKVNL
ncbi:Pantothenate synthetase [Buchnera aphidicola (Neophyllaphis podocarpi)]